MANSVATQIILDGARNTVIKVTGVLDTSDLGYTIIADPAALSGIDNTLSRKATGFRITKATFNVKNPNMALSLFWDAATPQLVQPLSSADNTLFDNFGGLTNNAVSPSGKIGISSNGWSGISTFSLVLELTKTGA